MMGCPWSKNSTVPDGLTGPEWVGMTVAVYVTLPPTLTAGFESSSEVEV
jgi:hypothetical protein